MRTPHFWLRWSLRDARARWLQILATGLVLALGIGAYSGLGGIRDWREDSAATSFRAANYHDLRITLGEDGYVPAGRLRAALGRLPDPGIVAGAQERLLGVTQVDAGRALVPGRIIGIDLRDGGGVDRVTAERGRTLTAADAGRRVAVLEAGFAGEYRLPQSGTVRLAGGHTLHYVGQGMHPQTYLVVDEGVSGAEASLAYVFMPLAAAQAVTGHPGEVNELAVRLRNGVDVATGERAVRRAVEAALPSAGFAITRGTQEDAYRVLQRDARNDQRLYRMFALLIIAAAGLAAFNLIGRAVEAQRRELGIGMALGVPPRTLAVRPLLMAAQIGLVGAVLSVGVGISSSEALKGGLAVAYPLPEYASGIQWAQYPLGIAIALVLPLVAAAGPVRRSIRMRPIEAIDVSPRASSSRRAGRVRWLANVRLPGRSLGRMPLRDLARAPRRTALTAVGLAGVISAVVAILGMVDSFQATADRSREELLRTAPSRVVAALDGLRPADDAAVRAALATPGAGRAEAGLTIGATVRSKSGQLNVALGFVDRVDALWRPAVTEGSGRGGIVLSRRAAGDLGVEVGDTIVVRHPARRGQDFGLADTQMRVAGIHANPARPYAYADAAKARTLGLGGLVNTVTAVPAAGTDPLALQRALLGRPHVASAQPARASVDTLQDGVDTFTGAIQITVVMTLALAVLIAFGSAGLAIEERRREFATMFAFGLPIRSALGLAVVENAIVGVVATIAGAGLGILLLRWIVTGLFSDTLPDLGTIVALSGRSLMITALVGVGSVAAAPLLMRRRLRRMNIPATLRVVE